MTARPLLIAMLCASTVTAEFVGGKATRDALFLTSLDVTALPSMLMATALCSILLVAAHSRLSVRLRPATLVPLLFAVSGALFLVEWLLRPIAPSATAVLVYLHVSGAGPLLASGFWLIASERFDPRTAKARFGQIAGAGTLGGLLGALLAERVAAHLGAPPMLIFLGGLQFLAAWLVWLLADRATPAAESSAVTSREIPSGLKVIATAPHLRHLMTLVVLGTTSAALLEYLFKSRAVETFGPGDGLLRFFALYYAVISLMTFVLQVFGSSAVLRRSGLALTTSSPSIALLAGSLGGLLAPGFGSLVVARAGESIFRGSWFRAGYEQFFTPMGSAEKRAAKPFIDVILDRLGDAFGGGLIRLVVVFIPLASSPVILTLAMACSIGAMVAASHLNRWYLRTLEKSLVNQGGVVDWAETQDGATARMVLGFRRSRNASKEPPATSVTTVTGEASIGSGGAISLAAKSEVQDVLVLRLGSRERIKTVLSRTEGLAPGLVPHVVPLLGWDAVADYASFALRKVAEEHVGALIDALLNPNHGMATRQRLARVLSICVSQRAVDGLILALDDDRFEVRYQAARSLVSIVEKNARIRIDRASIERIVLDEIKLARPIWEGRRLLAGSASASPFDLFVKDRAGQSLAHVFSLLSLILPREPLQIAFRSLNSDDDRLRGTALEYLDEVLPVPVRLGLWPFLAQEHTVRAPAPAMATPDAPSASVLIELTRTPA
jgi:AAA family ATP:ADP antiporter